MPLKKEKGKKDRKRRREDCDTQSVMNFSLSEPSTKKFRRPLSFLSLASLVKDSHKGASQHIKVQLRQHILIIVVHVGMINLSFMSMVCDGHE